MTSTLTTTVSQAIAACDYAVATISVWSRIDTSRQIVEVNFAEMEPGVDVATPRGVTALSMARVPPAIIETASVSDEDIIAAAWAFGAWDIVRTAVPDSTHPIARMLGGQDIVSWTCRPMMGGPLIRQKAHGGRDITLHPHMMGRDGTPPSITLRPIRPGRQQVIVLGGDPAKRQGPPRPASGLRATDRQRATIVGMRRRAGLVGLPLPAALTRAEASRIISDLILMLGDKGSD